MTKPLEQLTLFENKTQGASAHTERKEFEIHGISTMRFNQFKNPYFKYRKIICADIFSGTGENEVDGNIINGSPIKLIEAYIKSKNNNVKFDFLFSDIRSFACQALAKNVSKYPLNITIRQLEASNSINILGDHLYHNNDVFLYLIVDPNGPKDFPKIEIQQLLSSMSKRIDVIPYISATTINRCIGARNKAGLDFKGWLGQIENFDEGFVSSLIDHNRKGWIRKPLSSDKARWTMLPTFGCFEPIHDWAKQDYVKLNTQEGKNVVKYYCGEF